MYSNAELDYFGISISIAPLQPIKQVVFRVKKESLSLTGAFSTRRDRALGFAIKQRAPSGMDSTGAHHRIAINRIQKDIEPRCGDPDIGFPRQIL